MMAIIFLKEGKKKGKNKIYDMTKWKYDKSNKLIEMNSY